MKKKTNVELVMLKNCSEWAEKAAYWFSSKWGIPVEAYDESIRACIEQKNGIPQWYIVLNEQQQIIAGAGVIENDFHDRKDLAPNLCALFVDEEYRRGGVARLILEFVRKDLNKLGFEKVYLATDHTAFYEKYGWDFLTWITGDDGTQMRMYVASTI